MRQMESTKVASIGLCSESRPLDVCQTRSLPLRPSNWASFTERLGVYFSLLSDSALGVVAGQEQSHCYSPKGPRNASPAGHESQTIKGCFLGGSHKNKGTRDVSQPFSGKYWCFEVWQRKGAKMVSNGLGPQRVHQQVPRCVLNYTPTLRPMLYDNEPLS